MITNDIDEATAALVTSAAAFTVAAVSAFMKGKHFQEKSVPGYNLGESS